MSKTVILSEKIISEAKIAARALNRSVAGQIEYWVKIGKIVETNPNLTYSFIKDIIKSRQEAKDKKLEPYIFE